MSGLERLVRLYPPSFQARYGEELRGVVADTDAGWAVALNLVVGAARAWLRPAISGPPDERATRRRVATLSTVWIAWCLGCCAVPAINRLLLDPPLPTATATSRALLTAAQIVAAVGAVIAVAGCALVGLRVLRESPPPLRRRVLMPMLPVAVLVVVELAGLALIAWRRAGYPAQPAHFSVGFVVALAAWVLGFGLLVLAAAVGPVVALHRAAPRGTPLRVPTWLAASLAVVLAIAAGLNVAAVTTARAGVFGWLAAMVGAALAAAALVSANRGLRVDRSAA